MNQSTKEWWREKAIAVKDWVLAHPWPVAAFIGGFWLGLML